MWPSISIPFGDQTAQVYTYSLMVGLGLCHLLIGVDAGPTRRAAEEEMGRYLYCLAIASPGGWLVSKLITRLLYPGTVGNHRRHAGFDRRAAAAGPVCETVSGAVGYLSRVNHPVHLLYACVGAAGLFPGGCCHGAPTDLSNITPTGKPGMSGTRRRSGSPHATLRNVSTDRAGCGYANPNHPKPPDHGLPDWLRLGRFCIDQAATTGERWQSSRACRPANTWPCCS